jgi:hypothetical protein
MTLQTIFGTIPNIYGIGHFAKVLFEDRKLLLAMLAGEYVM